MVFRLPQLTSGSCAPRGAIEPVLAALLFGMELTGQLRSEHWWPLALGAALCLAAAISPWRPVPAAVVTSVATVAMAVMRDQWGASLYAPLVTVLGCLFARATRSAFAATVVSWAALTGLTARFTSSTADVFVGAVLWAGLFTIPWFLELGWRHRSRSETSSMLADLEEQRREIATELHDTLAQDLARIVMQAESARLAHPNLPNDAYLATIGDVARQSISELRHLMELLRVGSRTGQLKLPDMLDNVVTELESSGHPVSLHSSGALDDLRPAVSDTMARVLREGTNNIVRHAPAGAPCTISITRDGDRLTLSLTNPTTPGTSSDGGGIGLIGISTRIESLNGTVRTRSTPASWTLEVTLPQAA